MAIKKLIELIDLKITPALERARQQQQALEQQYTEEMYMRGVRELKGHVDTAILSNRETFGVLNVESVSLTHDKIRHGTKTVILKFKKRRMTEGFDNSDVQIIFALQNLVNEIVYDIYTRCTDDLVHGVPWIFISDIWCDKDGVYVEVIYTLFNPYSSLAAIERYKALCNSIPKP